MHFAWLRCGHLLAIRSYDNRLPPEIDPTWRWCGDYSETVSHIFEECSQRTVERAELRVSIPQEF